MHLFLSSYRAGQYPDRLKEFFSDPQIAVLTNAKDYKTSRERKESVDEVLDFFRDLKFQAVEIDLRPYFGKPQMAIKELSKYKSFWVAGGNTFVLRKALKYSGVDNWLLNKVHQDELRYGGESAGAVLATPTFTGVQFGDDPDIIPKGYGSETLWKGLGFVPYHIVPHYKSEWLGAEDMIKALRHKELAYRTLTDDQVIIVDGDKEEILT